MASSKVFKIVVLILSFFQLASSLTPYLPSFDSYRRSVRIGIDLPVLTARNGKEILWSDLFVQKLGEFMATAWTPNILQGLQDPVCMAHLAHIGFQLDQWINNGKLPDTFVLHLIDAWGKLPSGILRGHLADPGDFEECINARGYLNSSIFPLEAKGAYSMSIALFSTDAAGRENPGPQPNRTSGSAVTPDELLSYMLSDAGAFMPMIPMLGTCFPNTCSPEDTQQFVNNVIRATFGDQIFLGLLPRITADKPPLDTAAVAFIAGVAILLSVCVVGTIVDLFNLGTKGQEAGAAAILKSFSLYTNTLNLLKAPETNSRMTCLHGLEFLSFASVLLAHSWRFRNFQLTWNAVDFRESVHSGWVRMLIVNATVAFDSLFVINGTIAASTMLRSLDKDKKLNFLSLYGWKYLRITLPVLFIVAFGAMLLPYVGNGPFWYTIDLEASSCASHWWHNILHVSTLIPYDREDPGNFMCHTDSWYVANDMIYFLLSPMLVYLLWCWPKVGLGLLLLWMVQPIVQSGVMIDLKDLAPTYIPSLSVEALQAYFDNLYTQPWIRSTPYTVGLLLGYLLYHYWRADDGLKFYHFYSPSGFVLALLWTASGAIAFAVLYGPVMFYEVAFVEDTEVSMAAVAYGSLHRFAWAIVIAWVIFACLNEYPGWMSRLLSWQPLVSLGRLSLCMYLCAQYIQWVHKVSRYEPVRYNASNFLEDYVFHLVLSILAGFCLYVTVQAPIERLQNLIEQKQQEGRP